MLRPRLRWPRAWPLLPPTTQRSCSTNMRLTCQVRWTARSMMTKLISPWKCRPFKKMKLEYAPGGAQHERDMARGIIWSPDALTHLDSAFSPRLHQSSLPGVPATFQDAIDGGSCPREHA